MVSPEKVVEALKQKEEDQYQLVLQSTTEFWILGYLQSGYTRDIFKKHQKVIFNREDVMVPLPIIRRAVHDAAIAYQKRKGDRIEAEERAREEAQVKRLLST